MPTNVNDKIRSALRSTQAGRGARGQLIAGGIRCVSSGTRVSLRSPHARELGITQDSVSRLENGAIFCVHAPESR